MKKIFAAFLFFAFGVAGAQTINGILEVKKITTEVAKVADKYANAISCVDGPILAKNIFALKPAVITKDESSNEGEGEYLVFWDGDVGCNFGNRSVTQNFAFVEISTTNAVFFVNPLKSSPSVEIPVNGWITNIVGTHKDLVVMDVAESGEYNYSEPKRSRQTFKIKENGKWVLVSKGPIPLKK